MISRIQSLLRSLQAREEGGLHRVSKWEGLKRVIQLMNQCTFSSSAARRLCDAGMRAWLMNITRWYMHWKLLYTREEQEMGRRVTAQKKRGKNDDAQKENRRRRDVQQCREKWMGKSAMRG